MTAALLLHASCAHCTRLAGGLRTHDLFAFAKLYKSNLNLSCKRTPSKGFHRQTQKDEHDGCISAEHKNHLLCQLHKEESDGFPTAEDGNSDPLLESLHANNGRLDEPNTNDSKYNAECHVEAVSWRERRITASIVVDASPQCVWDVLTDYERLSEFIPNLVCSEKIPCPYPGRIWLLQRGLQRMMYWNIEAHVVLDLREFIELETGSELHFFMVDGDFKRYDGKWYLRTGPRPQTTLLHYEVNVVPKVIFPAAFVESIIKADLPRNLCAIAKRAEAESEADKELLNIPNKHASARDAHVNCPEEACEIINTNVTDLHWSGFGRACKLGNHRLADEIHFRRLDDLLENGGVHRQVAATITVKASSKDVWNVLTAYEALPEFVPNLANSVVLSREGKKVRLLQEGCKCLLYMVLHARVILDLLEQPEQEISFKQVEGDFSFFQGNWTLSQLGSQHTVLKYSVDTKILKDCILAESLVEEVIYEDLPSNLCAIRDRVESLASSPRSLLICPPDASNSTLLSGSEVVDLCPNSEAPEIEDAIGVLERPELQQASTLKDTLRDPVTKLIKRRARVKGLMDDYRVLEKELRDFIAAHGVEGVMPMRKHLRQHGRSDLGKAIRAMGGFHTVAARMKLSLSYKERKPVGYWDDVRNLRNEVIAAQKELRCDTSVLPSRLSLERSGRYNLARALEKWGGAKETARILGLKTKALQRRERRHKKTSAVSASLIDSAIPSDLKKDEERHLNDDAVNVDGADGFSPEVYLRAIAAYIEEASLRKHEATSSSAKHGPSQQTTAKVVSHSSESNKETAQNSSSDTSPLSQVKDKKMPYKTGVPQESSKWLTLFTDADDNPNVVNE